MGSLTAIDPGIRTGVAWFIDGKLVNVQQCKDEPVAVSRLVVIECPEYQKGRRCSPNDLITLARRVGRWEERVRIAGGKCVLVKPSEWKGSVPKRVHHARILARLEADERDVLETSSVGPDAMDAIGIGLWYLGRMK